MTKFTSVVVSETWHDGMFRVFADDIYMFYSTDRALAEEVASAMRENRLPKGWRSV